MIPQKTDVAIIGGGPVGLYLAGRLLQSGISCVVLEKKSTIDIHSKSLGIHPVSLELFDEAGITPSFLEEGLKIERGIAFWNREKIGEISFKVCPEPHQYILAIPQWKTEQILEDWVTTHNKSALFREAEVQSIRQTDSEVIINGIFQGEPFELTTKFAVGCDGKNSFVRQSFNIPFDGGPYPDYYIMGDFDDNTEFGKDAAVYLHKDGLVESFPLPNGHRRWVVKTDKLFNSPILDLLHVYVKNRIKHRLYEQNNYMTSSFGVQQFLARSLHSKRILLAGDAAHVVSPIGGQGMNLGWVGAERCCEAIISTLDDLSSQERSFAAYTKQHRKVAKKTARRAEMNMNLGRKQTSGSHYKFAVSLMLKPPLARLMANLFTMRGLDKWPV